MDFILTTLGTSAAGPVPGRWASGQYLKTTKHGILFDCGEGTQIALQEHGIGWSAIDTILISHLHGDHVYGLPGLLTSWGLNQRSTPLRIIAPPGLADWLDHTFRFSHTGLPFPLEVNAVDPNTAPKVVFEDKDILVETLPLQHRVPTMGFVVREQQRPRRIKGESIQAYSIPYRDIPAIKAGADFITKTGETISNSILTESPPRARSFAYCSDTAPLAKLIPLIKEVDILYHEATFLHDMAEQAIKTGHSTARQAAAVAAEAGVGQLVIGHFSPRYGKLTPLLAEAQTHFPNTELAAAGRTFSVPFDQR